MEKNLQLVKNLQKTKLVLGDLHPDVLDILFENRKFMKNVFENIKGIHEVDHFGLTIIDPLNKLITFSTTPNIEYNLINQNLWQFDPVFSKNTVDPSSIIWWDELPISIENDKVKTIKLSNNKYALGVSLNRQVNDFSVIYSFATKSTDEGLKNYYVDNLSGLIDIGDYCYKLIHEVYLQYCDRYMPPKVQSLTSKIYHEKSTPYLKLIVTN